MSALLVACLLLCVPASRADAGTDEIRGLWVLRTSLTTPEAVADMVRTARTNGFNTILVQVRGRGEVLYLGGSEPLATQLAGQPASFDPLAETLRMARDAGLRVHAWVNVNLVASATYLPASRSHVIYRHPEWLMVPRALAQEMARVDPHSPAYVGRLARWTRGRSAEMEGLYASPIHAGYAAHMESLIADLAKRYALDGVHLDYVRYPGDQFDYSRQAIAEFQAEIGRRLPAADRQRLEARSRVDLFAYPDAFPEGWAQFRRSRLSALVMRLRTAVKAHRPEALVTAAVFPHVEDAYGRKFQDWRTWLEGGLVDVVCPMAYTQDSAAFAGQIGAAGQIAGPLRVWAGIGAYRLPPARTVERIRAARRLGAAGFVLFSYDSLTDPAQHRTDYLTQVARAAFADRRDAGGSR